MSIFSLKKKERYNKTNPFYNALIENIGKKRHEHLQAVEAFESKKRTRIYFNNKKIDTVESKISDSMDMRKNKMLIEFNDSESSSVKHIAVK